MIYRTECFFKLLLRSEHLDCLDYKRMHLGLVDCCTRGDLAAKQNMLADMSAAAGAALGNSLDLLVLQPHGPRRY